MLHTRARIRLETPSEVQDFVSRLNSDGTIHKYILEDKDCQKRVDARSYLGAIYASADFSGEIYLVNETEDGKFPSFVDEFMIY